MNPAKVSPRVYAAIGAFAVLPVLAYGLGRSVTAGTVATVNVLIVMSALYLMFGPIDTSAGHANGGHANA